MKNKKYSKDIYELELEIQKEFDNLKKEVKPELLDRGNNDDKNVKGVKSSVANQSQKSSAQTNKKEASFYIAIFCGIISLVTFFIFKSKAEIYKENRTSFFTGMGMDKKYVEQGGVGGLSDIINNTQDGATILIVIGVSGLAAIIAIFAHFNKSNEE